jgi:hypothetical protein
MTRDRAGTGYGFLAAWIALHCSCVGRKLARLTSRPARQCAVARRST